MFQRIVCPVDFSDHSAYALGHAGQIAERTGGRLAVVHVSTFEPPAYFTPARLEALADQYRQSRGDVEAALRQFAGTALPGRTGIHIEALEGPIVDAIQAFAGRFGADLIVAGTHGRTGVSRWTLGSVAERLVHESQFPVLTVRRPAAPIRQIVCPVDDSPLARETLALAAELAGSLGAALTAVHVQEPGQAVPVPGPCAWLGEQAAAQCALREVVRQGDPAAEILAAGAETGCDLLVIGARHRAFFDTTIIGSTTARVVRHAPCPVLTVMERHAEAAHA